MQGLGKPGAHQMKMLEWGRRMLEESNPMPRGSVMPNVMKSVYTGGMLITTENTEDRTGDMSKTAVKALKVSKQIIPKNLIHDAILKPPISWQGTTSCTFPLEDQFVTYTYPAPGCPEVHMIWTDSPCWITCWNDSNEYIRALRQSQDRVHRGPAPLDGERLHVRRPHPAGQHQVRGAGTSPPTPWAASSTWW